MSHQTRTVLITGCTKGSIGYSLARQFAQLNYRVFAASRNISTMQDLASTSPNNITLLALDVTSRPSLLAAHALIAGSTGGKLDILYQNAGYKSSAMATETLPLEAAKMINTNFTAVIETNEIFADLVLAARGRIVITGSIAAFAPTPTESVYCASKAALALYVRTLRLEMRPLGVRVTMVHTGGVRSGMSSRKVMLAPESPWRYLEDKLAGWSRTGEAAGMDTETYAQEVATKVASTKPPDEIWKGNSAFGVWLLEVLGWQWFYEFYFSRMFGLNARAPVAEKKTQ